ncbi:uncharacterized protein LOC119568476 [Penaeus monodon]|uniref:uncharacterized protein LOC119568476 n=1 Tax=Penaeus monodon TaxID=6687 RepID=UPI0018A73407|nr:uncharacterized protein LOC119568476 [Penaeus monodon]
MFPTLCKGINAAFGTPRLARQDNLSGPAGQRGRVRNLLYPQCSACKQTKMDPIVKFCSAMVAIVHYLMEMALCITLLKDTVRRMELSRALITEKKRCPQSLVKSGIGCHLFLAMDDDTFQSHMRLRRRQFNFLNDSFGRMGMAEVPKNVGGQPRVPLEMKTAMFLWYMANQNSFREIGDKFNVSRSTAHEIIVSALDSVCQLAASFITWPDENENLRSSRAFQQSCSRERIIGAIDGCHIKIQRPRRHGIDYMNQKRILFNPYSGYL